MDQNWKRLFRPTVLERGEEYRENGAVENLQRTPDGWEAVVIGSREYEVEICTDGDTVEEMYCTCPYAENGNNCKHMAAVLFAVPDYIEEPDEAAETAQDVLRSMNEEELRRELQGLMRRDPRVKERIFAGYRTRPTQESDLARFEKHLVKITHEYGDGYGYIGWDAAEDFCEAVTDVMNDFIEPMIKRKEDRMAFRAVGCVFDLINEVIIDASCNEIAEAVEDAWTRIIRQAEEPVYSGICRWFSARRQRSHELPYGSIIESVFWEAFEDEEHLDLLLKEVLRDLNDPAQFRANGYSLLKKYRDLLSRMNRPLDPFEQWMNDHSGLKEVRRLRLEEAEERNDTDAVLCLLRQLYSSSDDIWDQRRYARRLLKEYEELQDIPNQKIWLLTLFRIREIDPEELRKLRSLSTQAEWNTLRESYILDHPDEAPRLFAEEGLYSRLADILPDQPVKVADQYRDLLKNEYPETLVDIYYSHIRTLEEHHPCRSLYQEMKKYLLILSGIPGGNGIVSSLIRTWQVKYPTCTAMQAMLSETVKSVCMV